jgi:SAM-dependent methyltransferase
MIGMWNLPPETVMPVKYIVTRDKRMDEQIKDRFDYIISCHVIEHVPNPIGYILELRNLLNPDGPGIIFIAAPDKRCTHDLARPTTSLEHLLSDYFEDARYPSIEHILEFRKHWVPGEDIPIVERYGFAVNNFNSGRADVHCHVWSDHEFFDQINQLCVGRILENMGVAKSQGTLPGYNEFTICLVALKDASK